MKNTLLILTTRLLANSRTILGGGLFLYSLPLLADPQIGISVHNDLKYTPSSTHFAYANPNASKGGTLRLAEIAKVDSMNPYILKGDSTAFLVSAVYGTLMKRAKDEPFAMYGYIAESVEMPDDRSFIIFNLRPIATFEDGSPITADDVVFTFNLIKEKGNPRYKMNYSPAKSIEKLSEKSVKITFDPAKSDKESPLIISMMPVLSKAYYSKIKFEESTMVKPLASGPYRVKAFEPGKKLELERIKNYWGENILCQKGMNNFDNVTISYFRDENVLFENFEGGGVDFFHETDFSRWSKSYDIPAVKSGKMKKAEIEHSRPFGMFGIAMNMRKPLFQNQDVRKALILLMDQDLMNKNYYNGFYKPITSFFGNCEMACQGPATDQETTVLKTCNAQVSDTCFDNITHPTLTPRERLRQALELFKKAGWKLEGKNLTKDGKPFEFELLIAEKPHEKIALGYADMLMKAGIKMNVRFVDSAQYNARKNNFEFDSVIHLWGVSASPGIEQNYFWSSAAADRPSSRNYPGIKDPAIDTVIEKLLQQTTRADYLHYVKALDRLLWSHDAIVPLVYWNKDLLAYWDKFGMPTYEPDTARNLIYLSQYERVLESWWTR